MSSTQSSIFSRKFEARNQSCLNSNMKVTNINHSPQNSILIEQNTHHTGSVDNLDQLELRSNKKLDVVKLSTDRSSMKKDQNVQNPFIANILDEELRSSKTKQGSIHRYHQNETQLNYLSTLYAANKKLASTNSKSKDVSMPLTLECALL